MYLIDANVLIKAQAEYYPIDRIPQFWEWLLIQARNGVVKIPFEIYNEITVSDDPLSDWLKDRANKNDMILDEEADRGVLNRVLAEGYAADLTEVEIEKIGQDMFLPAYALSNHPNRIVVTKEVSAITKLRGNRKLPDVCQGFGIPCIKDFEMYRILNFTTR